MASSDSDPNSERHHPLVLGLGARRRAPKDGNARHAAAPHTRHRGSGQQRSMATPRAAARTPASAANPPSNTNCTKRPGQKPHKQTVNNLRTTPLPEKSHVIYLGQFSICPENVGIATVGFQSLNNGEGNYVRHLWGTMRVRRAFAGCPQGSPGVPSIRRVPPGFAGCCQGSPGAPRVRRAFPGFAAPPAPPTPAASPWIRGW